MHAPVPQDGKAFVIQSIPIVNRTITIHKHQYNFDRQLGRGYFGEVYAARHLPDNRPVAIKVVSLATLHTGEGELLKEAFLNEVRMAKRLAQSSRHIVHMYDFDFHPTGLTFIIMELGEQNLEKALSSRPPLSSIERKVLWRQLVDIANTLHNHHIVHFDIKPHNLVVFPGNVIKLVDMGIARKAHRNRVGPNGTIPYSAPEVTTISHYHIATNSRKADVWSWGAVLYRMTYNTPPNRYYTPPCYNPPANQPSASDPHLVDVLRHTLVIEPGKRYSAPSLAKHPYTTAV